MMPHLPRRLTDTDGKTRGARTPPPAMATVALVGLVLATYHGRATRRPAAGGLGAERRRLDGTPADHGRRVRDPAEGRQRLRRGGDGAPRRRRRRAGPLRARRRVAGPRLPRERGRGHLRRRAGLGAQGSRHRVVPLARARPVRRGARPGRRSGRAPRGADGARAVGHDELRGGLAARHRVRGARLPPAAAHRPRHRGEPGVHGSVAGEPALLAEAGRLALRGGRDHPLPHPGRDAHEDGGGGARALVPGPRPRHRRRPRPLLQGRHRRGDGGLPAGARRPVRARRLRRVLLPRRGADDDRLPRLHHLQARLQQPGPGAAADAEHPGAVRPPGRWATTAPTTSTPSSRR